MFARIVCLAIGYAFGCFLTAEVVCRARYNVSVFSIGSKNPGMANVAIEKGFAPALLVFLGDAIKVILACVISYFIFREELGWTLVCLWAGLGTTLGHNYPVWHKFSGGEGVMTTCSTMVLATPLSALASLAVGAISVIVTQFLNLSAVILVAFWSALMFFTGNMEYFGLSLVFVALMVISNWHQLIKMFGPDADKEKVDVLARFRK